MRITEESVLTTQTSRWIAFGFLANKFMLLMLLVIIASGIGQFFEPELVYVFYGVGGLYLILFLARLFGMKKERVEVTNQRMIVRRRIGSMRRQITIPHNHMAMIDVSRGKMGRRLGFGHMVVYTSGNSRVNLESMAKVEELQESLHLQLTKQWRHVD